MKTRFYFHKTNSSWHGLRWSTCTSSAMRHESILLSSPIIPDIKFTCDMTSTYERIGMFDSEIWRTLEKRDGRNIQWYHGKQMYSNVKHVHWHRRGDIADYNVDKSKNLNFRWHMVLLPITTNEGCGLFFSFFFFFGGGGGGVGIEKNYLKQ